MKDNPTRKVVWIVDQLFRMLNNCKSDLEVALKKHIFESGLVLLINPDYDEGLEPQHLTRVDSVLNNKLTRDEIEKKQ